MADKRSFINNQRLDDDSPGVTSKSAKKREMLSLQALGQELAELSKRQYAKINFPSESVADALTFYRGIPDKKYEAKRRQMQFIGKLMRNIEPEVLQVQLQAIKKMHSADKRKHQLTEQWRDRLISDPKQVTEFLNQFNSNAQSLNSAVRDARRVKDITKDRGESKTLYRILFEAIAH
jgi:ribosome-associated protein